MQEGRIPSRPANLLEQGSNNLRKLKAAGHETDFISRNRDLSNAAGKRQQEQEDKEEPVKNPRYEKVPPRYLSHVNYHKKSGQEALPKPARRQEEDLLIWEEAEDEQPIRTHKGANKASAKHANQQCVDKENVHPKHTQLTPPVKPATNTHDVAKKVVKVTPPPVLTSNTQPASKGKWEEKLPGTKVVSAVESKPSKDNCKKPTAESKGYSEIEPRREPATTKAESKDKDRSLSRNQKKYKPENVDLFTKLNEYTKYQNNVNLISQPDPAVEDSPKRKPAHRKVEQVNANEKQEKLAEEFVKSQINTFKEKKEKQVVQTRASQPDLSQVSQPRFKKQPHQMVDNYTYQPMLSKKSMAILEKTGYSKENLYSSKTPAKHQNSHEEECVSFKPRICEKSKYLDKMKHKQDVPRFEMLNIIGQEYSHKKRKVVQEKLKEDEAEFRSIAFRPQTAQRSVDPHLKVTSAANVVDRNEKWAQRKEERLQREQEKKEEEFKREHSFKPKIVRGF